MYLNQVRGFVNIKIISRKCHKIYYNERLTDFPESYNLRDVRKGWYEVWESKKYFQPEDDDRPIYKMILPPPNVTGTLHLGHALTTTVQDILARWYKMKGYSITWVPGFDHAGIATQAVVERYLQKTKNVKRSDMTKEEFLKVMEDWKNEKRSIITDQLRTLGASLDWTREYFTISDHHNKAVTHAFVELHKKGFLYRSKSLINWSTALGSTLSDIEVEFESLSGKTDLEVPGYDRKVTFGEIFEISYDVVNSDKKLSVATTRPETLLGDVALAVHPDDDRYSQYIGQKVKHPLKEFHIPVIADPGVKMDFGTGVVKITPAHDHFDYDIAKKHDLRLITVIDKDGKLTTGTKYAGMLRFHARKKILEDLAKMGALISAKDHAMEIPRCSRTGDIIELLLKEQWFIKSRDLSLRALRAVEDGQLKLNPSFYNKTWIDWLSNNKDWCVSRQLWWGHQIPAYHYKIKNTTKWVVAASLKEALNQVREEYGNEIYIRQDSDVLDTWFSSSLLPFSAMGWLTNKKDFEKFYPLSLMETGNDILCMWIARMTMLGLELTNKLPFNEVLLHGVLCDAQGKKMSKSRGNVLNPENVLDGISLEGLNDQATKSFEAGILNKTELKRTTQMNTKMFPKGIPECGVDALRFTLCSHNIKERTVSFNIVECEQNKFFCNKIWQASRYVVLMTSDDPIETPETFSMLDQWILSRLAWMVYIVNKELEQKNFHKAVKAIKEFLYHEFCDYYIEGTKQGFQNKQLDVINSHRYTLAKCLEVSLKILAPFMPYLSDDLYSRLSKKLSIFDHHNSLLGSSYPSTRELEYLRKVDLENQISQVIDVIQAIRGMIGILSGSEEKSKVEVYIGVRNPEECRFYQDNVNLISAAVKLNKSQIFMTENFVRQSTLLCEREVHENPIYVQITDERILEKARKLLEKKRTTVQKKLDSLMKLKSGEKYLKKMSEEDKVKHEEQIFQLQEELKKLSASA